MRRANVIRDDQLNPSCIIPGVFIRASPRGGRRGTGYGGVIPGDNFGVRQVHEHGCPSSSSADTRGGCTLTELIQHFELAHRGGDVLNALADFGGAALGALVYLVWSRRQP